MADSWDLAELVLFLRALSITYNGFYIFTMSEKLMGDRFSEFGRFLKDFNEDYNEVKRGLAGSPNFGYIVKSYFIPTMSDLIQSLKLRTIQIQSPGFIEVEGLKVPLEAIAGLVTFIITRFFPNKDKKTAEY